MVGPISSSFQSSNQVSWLGTSYLLALATTTPLYGKLSDIIGRRYASLIAIFLFTAGTFLCGVSKSMPMLIAARGLAGCGGGGIMTISSIVASDIIPLKKRGLIQGIVNIFYGLGGLGVPPPSYVLTLTILTGLLRMIRRSAWCTIGRSHCSEIRLAFCLSDTSALPSISMDPSLHVRSIHSTRPSIKQARSATSNRLARLHLSHRLHIKFPSQLVIQEQFLPTMVRSQGLGYDVGIRGILVRFCSGRSFRLPKSCHATADIVAQVANL